MHFQNCFVACRFQLCFVLCVIEMTCYSTGRGGLMAPVCLFLSRSNCQGSTINVNDLPFVDARSLCCYMRYVILCYAQSITYLIFVLCEMLNAKELNSNDSSTRTN